MASQPAPVFDYDVFISYSHRDSEWVNSELLPRLLDAGLKVCIDHRDFQVGASFVFEMERAVKTSRHTLLVLTPAYVESDWATFENMLVASRDPFNLQRSLIPLLVEPCDLPERIASYIHVNFTAPGVQETVWRQLLRAVGV